MTIDPAKIVAELKRLQANPEFEERPATIAEFLGEGYLDIEKRVRPAIREELIQIFGDEVSSKHIAVFGKAMITGGIGIGKTTIASIVLPYLAHWVLCLKNPQEFFNLLPGSRIAFMQMSTSGSQAKEVVFRRYQGPHRVLEVVCGEVPVRSQLQEPDPVPEGSVDLAR